MDKIWIFVAIITTINAGLALTISFRLSRKKNTLGTLEMSLMFVGLAIWAFFYGLTAVTADMALKLFWLKMENLGIASVPVLWFLFAARFTKRDNWLIRPVVALFWIIPLITWILLFSGQWFHLYYMSAIPSDGDYGPFIIGRASWYYVQFASTYILLAFGAIMLLWRVIHYRSLYRRQIFAILIALAIPWLINVLYQLGPKWLTKIDLTPITFTVSAFLISASVFRMQLFDLVPIARHIVLEHIPEMVLVVDDNDRLLDANSVAQDWLQEPVDELIGRNIHDILGQWPQLADRFEGISEFHDEIHITGDSPRVLDLVITPLKFGFRFLKGRVIVAHDVSQRKKMEVELKMANETLAAKLHEIEALQAQLREQAIRDPLTKVYNRRYLAESLDGIIARAERENYPVSIIIMDVDHFKQFNDTHGHKCGDLVLEYLGSLLMKRTRRSDVVCRYGGEEFVIVMPNVTLEVALTRADEWRTAFERSPLNYESMLLKTTFSAGVASYPCHGTTGEVILQAADKALYKSKDDGRNRVTVFETQKNLT